MEQSLEQTKGDIFDDAKLMVQQHDDQTKRITETICEAVWPYVSSLMKWWVVRYREGSDMVVITSFQRNCKPFK
jgi:hypothetical protein